MPHRAPIFPLVARALNKTAAAARFIFCGSMLALPALSLAPFHRDLVLLTQFEVQCLPLFYCILTARLFGHLIYVLILFDD